MSLLLLFKSTGLTQVVGGTVASAAAITKQSARTLVGALTPAATLAKATVRILSSTVAVITGAITKQTQRALTGGLTPSGALQAIRIVLVALSSSVVIAGAVTKLVARTFTGSLTPAGAIVKKTLRTLAALLAPLGGLGTRVVRESTVLVYIAGTDRTSNVRLGSLEIEDVLNDAPNRCTFTCVGLVPAEGAVVSVQRSAAAVIEFAGHILQVQQFYEGIPANVAHFVTCQDYTWKLNRRLVTKRWTNMSATTIFQEIISGFTTGFTSTNVAAGLATLAEFECEEELPSVALTRLCAEIGGNWYVDYALDLHAFLVEATAAPDDISDATLATTTARGLAHLGDLSQVRTRVKGTGAAAAILENIITTLTSLPLATVEMFSAAGGKFRSRKGPNIGDYTGKHDGGVAATVLGNVAAPGSAPSAAVASGVVGVLPGNYQYKVAFANAQGETTPSSASNTVNCAAFSPPSFGSVAASGVIGPLVGAYLYVLTYVTSLGETTAGSSFGRTATAVAAPGAGVVGAGSTIGKLIGAYNYKVTFVTPFGETEGGTLFSRTAVAVSTPGAPSVAAVVSTMGKLIGAYGYKITVVNADGNESAASIAGSRTANAQSAPSAPTHNATTIGPLFGSYYYKTAFVGPDGHETLGSASTQYTHNGSTATAPAVGSTGSATGLNIRIRVVWIHPIYGESIWSAATEHTNHLANVNITATGLPSGCTWQVFSTGSFSGAYAGQPYYRMPTIYSGTSSQPLDTVSGAVATSGAGMMGGNNSLTIATGPTGTTARRIYRTRVGGASTGPYYLVGTVSDNSTTSFNDVVPDQALIVGEPTANLNGEQHSVTSIGTGPTGTTKRRIYRTKTGGSVYFLLDEILDNVTTSYTDNIPDSQLNLSITAPSTATAGDQHALSSIPTGPSGTLARRLWRTAAGGSIYYLLHEIPDNVTTTYTDNKSDAELGADAVPTVSTAGGQAHSLTVIPTGPTGTLARRIYRTVAGGASFQFVGELGDNVTTNFTDDRADEELGTYVPLVNTAGANKVAVSSIALGGAGVTKRILYRTEDGGSVYKYVATINDNVTTTYTDNTPDTSLGREALTQSTIGAVPGDMSLLLSTVTGWPTAGWLKAGSQLIRWTGISGTSLTGIPGARSVTSITRSGTTATATTSGAHGFTTGEVVTLHGAAQPEYTGAHTVTVTSATTFTYTVAGAPATPATGTINVYAVGAILASIPGGSGVVTAPFLSGVTGLSYAIEKGAPVHIYTVRNGTAAQTALAALEGGDGIHESPINDSTIRTVAALEAACDADLDAYSGKLRTITFRSRDPKLRSGKTVTLSLGSPTSLSGSFLIQRVISSEFDTAPTLNPMREVIAAPVRLSFQDVLRRTRNDGRERIL